MRDIKEDIILVDSMEEGVLQDLSTEEIEVLEDSKESDGKAVDGVFQTSNLLIPANVKNNNLKMENVEETVNSLSPSLARVSLGWQSRKAWLNILASPLEYTTKLWGKVKSSWSQRKKVDSSEEEAVVEAFRPLTDEEESEVSDALNSSERRKLLVTHESSNIDITVGVLHCLRPRNWLNDEVINLYFELLKEREKREPQKSLKCHFFNTFFYTKLVSGEYGYNFQSVRRWTSQRKLEYSILECDKTFVPIHKEAHWCLAVINKKDEKFQYLDSLGGFDLCALKVLARYFVDEVKDKNGKLIDVSSWKQELVEDLPLQENRSDCGLFMIKYADFYSRDMGLCFKQEHMPYFRRRTAKEILHLKAD